MAKDKNRQKEYHRKWYQEHKGKPVEHKEVVCEVCGKKFTQKEKRQNACENKECRVIIKRRYNKLRSEKIPDRRAGYYRKWYDENTELAKGFSKKHYENNKELRSKQALARHHERYKTDEGYRMRRLLGTSLGYVIREYIKSGRIMNPMRKYGIDWEGIVKKLSPFPKDRENYHVDHIVPLFRFDLSNFEQIHIAFTPENHRWLKAKDNMTRSKLKRKRLHFRA